MAEKTRAILQGTSSGNINSPTDGITSTNSGKISAEDLRNILIDFSDSTFFTASDTADDITSGSANQFLTTTAQTIEGVKTFDKAPIMSAGFSFKNLPADTNAITIKGNSLLASPYTLKFPGAVPTAGSVLRVDSFAGGIADTSWVEATVSGTVESGVANRVAIYKTLDTLDDAGVGSSLGSYIALPAGLSKAYLIPAITGASSNFVMSTENQSISGRKSFADIEAIDAVEIKDSVGAGIVSVSVASGTDTYDLVLPSDAPSSNYLVAGQNSDLGFITIANVIAPVGAQTTGLNLTATTIGLYSAGVDGPGVVTTGLQTFAGEKRFNSVAVFNQGVSFKTPDNFSVALITQNVGSAYTLTLPANNGNAGDVLVTDGNGVMSWEDPSVISSIESGSTGSVALYTGANTIGETATVSGYDVSLEFATPSANTVYTIPAVGTSTFVMTAGTQTVTGAKTFNTLTGVSTSVGNSLQVYSTSDPSDNVSIVPTITVAQGAKTYSIPAVATSSEFVMNSGNQTISGSKTFSSGVLISATTNQLVLGTTNTVTLNANAPASSKVYNIPEVDNGSNFVMTTGNATIAGNKIFSGTIGIADATLSGNITVSGARTVVSTSGFTVGSANTDLISFWGASPIARPTGLTSPLSTLVQAGSFTPDYTIQDFTNTSPFGFATKDEAETVLSVIRNLQTRVNELENKLQSTGLIG